MGSGASAGVSAAVGAASDAELEAALAELSFESRRQFMEALVRTTPYTGPKIVAQRAYFHPAMGFGEHSDVYAQTEAGVRDYCEIVSRWSTDPAQQDSVVEDLMSRFAEEGSWSVEDPVGTPRKTTASAIKESLQAKTLVDTLKVKDVKVAHDERHCAALIEVTCKGAEGPPYHRIDIFHFSDAGKILELQSYTHPSDSPALADPALRTSVASQTEELVRAYAAARTNGHNDGGEAQAALFAGAFTMTDPVGTSAKTTHAEVKDFLQSLSEGQPSMTATEIFVSADERQCAALLEIRMTAVKGQPTFSVIDTFQLEDVLKVDTFDVDASADEVVGLLSAPSGWAKIVPGFAADPESAMLEASQGFRMTTVQNNWMWVTDIATREGLVFSVRITVTDPEEDPGPRPKKKLFSVIQTWTLTPNNGGCTIERKFTEYDGSKQLRGFLVGGMIDKENKLVVETLASKS